MNLFINSSSVPRTARNKRIYSSNASSSSSPSVASIDLSNLLKLSGMLEQTVDGNLILNGNFYAAGNIVAFSSIPGVASSWWDALPRASSTVLGGVKIGANLTIDENGVLSSTASGGGVSSWNDLLDKPAIHQHTDTFDFTSRTITINRIPGTANIKGGANDGVIVIDGYNANTGVYLNNYVAANTYIGAGGGKVMIGTQTPSAYKLTIQGDQITDGWIRTKNAQYGWYNEATSTGIYSPANKVVKVYNGGSLNVGGAIDGVGGVNLVPSNDANASGFLEIMKANGVRVGYIGYYTDRMFYNAEIGYHEFTGGIQTSKYCYCCNNGRGNIQITTDVGSLPGYPSDTYPTLKSSGLIYFSADGVYSGYMQNTNLTMFGNISAYSDARLKANLKPLTKVLDTLADINGYTYTRTDLEDKEKIHLGLIAQEVEKHYPQLVETNQETNTKSLNYQAFTAVLLEAIKEQQKRIEDLERRVK